MASSYIDPSARVSEERSRGAYAGWTNRSGSGGGGPSGSSGRDVDPDEEGESSGRQIVSGGARERADRGGGGGGGGGGADGFFVPNEDLGEGSVRMVCAPADADVMDLSDGGGRCFACNFVKKKDNPEDPFNDGEMRDAYADMMRLQQDNYGKMSTPELVNLIHDFYEREIRPMGYEAWTKTSIARHILFHQNDEDVMMQETTDILYAQLQSIRSRTWCENTAEGTLEPHHKNLNAMLSIVKTLDDHLTKKKNRVK